MQTGTTPQDAAEYLLTHLHQMAALAKVMKLPVVAYLLKMAALEAAMSLPNPRMQHFHPDGLDERKSQN